MEPDPGAGAGIAQFLVDDGIVAEVETEPAISLRYGRAEQARVPGRAPEAFIDLPLRLPPVEMRDQLALLTG